MRSLLCSQLSPVETISPASSKESLCNLTMTESEDCISTLTTVAKIACFTSIDRGAHQNRIYQQSEFSPEKTSGSPFAFGSFCHGAINQQSRQMLGTFIEFSIRFFQARKFAAFERGFNFIDQHMNLSPIVWFDLIADQS